MLKLKKSILVIISVFPIFSAYAVKPYVVATINAAGEENIIRRDISRTTFGGGVEFINPQFRDLMKTTTNAQTAIKSLNLGSFRFPNGTPALYYYWNMPRDSFINKDAYPGATKDSILTPDEIYQYTSDSALRMDKLFEVNTIQYLAPDYKLYPVINPGSSPATINTTNLNLAAQSAANWVADNFNKPLSSRVNNWEVGNEDWVYWTPSEYATIFNAFALKMKAQRSDIKLLAQSFTGTYKVTGKPENNHTWLQGLINGGIRKQDVYALSEHEYMNSGAIPSGGNYNDQRIWQTQNMFAQIANGWRIPYLKNTLAANNLPWKIWVTEFNVFQKDTSGQPLVLQDLGHALVIADWTGYMLSQNVEKIFMHSLDHHPSFSLVDYVNSNGTINAPKVTAPGYAFSKYSQSFGPKMVKNTLTGNATLSSYSSGNYPQVAVYSSVMESDPLYNGYPSMRIMVINRSYNDEADITLQTLNRPIAGSNKKYYVQTLSANNISDSNLKTKDLVKWSSLVEAPSNTNGIKKTLPKSSATFFIVPLQ